MGIPTCDTLQAEAQRLAALTDAQLIEELTAPDGAYDASYDATEIEYELSVVTPDGGSFWITAYHLDIARSLWDHFDAAGYTLRSARP